MFVRSMVFDSPLAQSVEEVGTLAFNLFDSFEFLCFLSSDQKLGFNLLRKWGLIPEMDKGAFGDFLLIGKFTGDALVEFGGLFLVAGFSGDFGQAEKCETCEVTLLIITLGDFLVSGFSLLVVLVDFFFEESGAEKFFGGWCFILSRKQQGQTAEKGEEYFYDE
ncbi:hypothetical protein N9Z92_03095 [Akkermansiaceae bacterium]|nr:hypothetical protein [Akkermansiaceae bacterium]